MVDIFEACDTVGC